MAVRSACGGKVLWNGVAIPDVRRWSFDEDEEEKKYSSSSTACKKVTLGGAVDVTGEIDVYINDENHFSGILEVTDVGELKLYEDADDFWTITNARITGISVEAPIEDGDPSVATIRFALGSDAVITPPA